MLRDRLAAMCTYEQCKTSDYIQVVSRAVPTLLTVSDHTQYMAPTINVKPDLGFPRE